MLTPCVQAMVLEEMGTAVGIARRRPASVFAGDDAHDVVHAHDPEQRGNQMIDFMELKLPAVGAKRRKPVEELAGRAEFHPEESRAVKNCRLMQGCMVADRTYQVVDLSFHHCGHRKMAGRQIGSSCFVCFHRDAVIQRGKGWRRNFERDAVIDAGFLELVFPLKQLQQFEQ